MECGRCSLKPPTLSFYVAFNFVNSLKKITVPLPLFYSYARKMKKSIIFIELYFSVHGAILRRDFVLWWLIFSFCWNRWENCSTWKCNFENNMYSDFWKIESHNKSTVFIKKSLICNQFQQKEGMGYLKTKYRSKKAPCVPTIMLCRHYASNKT